MFNLFRGVKERNITISPSIRTGVVPRLKKDSDRIVGVSLMKPFDFFTAAGRSSNPGGGLGLAMSLLSPTSSSEAKDSGILRDDILIGSASLLGSCQQIDRTVSKIC